MGEALTPERERSLLEDIRSLETRALSLNLLAEQLNSEQTKCLTELGALKTQWSRVNPSSAPKETVRRMRWKIRKLELSFPRPPHFMLRLALGTSGPFMLRPVKRRLEYKKEYEEFKLKMTLIATAAAFSSLFIYSSRLTDAMFAFLLLYYYCSVILREHILIVNGSRIRKWWLVHHYLSVITSGILLIWPSSPSYDQFRGPFLWFCLFLGALQYLQYRYQKQRLYVLIALEKANPMDTVTGEGVCNDKAGWDFALLVPFSILGQVWQLYSSVVMYEAYHSRPDNEWQIAAFGILFFALGVGNMLTTFQIFVGKLFGKKDKPPSRSASDEALNTKLGNKTK